LVEAVLKSGQRPNVVPDCSKLVLYGDKSICERLITRISWWIA